MLCQHHDRNMQGDTIVIPYNGENYQIDIKEVKPDKAVSVVETDVEVDFAPPKDYVEPPPRPPPEAASLVPRQNSKAGTSSDNGDKGAADAEPKVPQFTAFSGMPSQQLSHSALGSYIDIWEHVFVLYFPGSF